MSKKIVRKSRKGLTLIEVLAVLVIMGVIFAIAVPSFRSDVNKVEELGDRENIHMLEGAVKQFRLDTGHIPSDLDDLMTDPDVPGWEGPYLESMPQSPGSKQYRVDPATGSVSAL